MDSLTYNYNKGKNQLRQVLDAVPAGNYPNDIDNEPGSNNYKYNAIGELAKDSAGGLDTITWTVYGKVKEVKKTNGDSILFVYDPLGNRLEKKVYPHSSTADTTTYTRDAQGNIMAMYSRRKDTVHLNEWDIYGSKRLGSVDTAMRVYPLPAKHNGGALDSATIAYLENQKQYELDNHLGNVLVTISDRKWPVDTAVLGYAQYYLPTIITANDYYPYGQYEPGRQYSLTHYDFGFNGKLKDDSIFGAGNWYDYGMRNYDDRIPVFPSPDPIEPEYPFYSPYQYAGDNPIRYRDRDGEEPQDVGNVNNEQNQSSPSPYAPTTSGSTAQETVNGPYANPSAAQDAALSGQTPVDLPAITITGSSSSSVKLIPAAEANKGFNRPPYAEGSVVKERTMGELTLRIHLCGSQKPVLKAK